MTQTQLPHDRPKLIGGIDEAGRGAVIGPLVVGGVVLPEISLEKLVELGVKDSKQLTPKKRTELSESIRKLPIKWELAEISPQCIDAAIKSVKSNLNFLELQHMARICLSLTPDVVYVDALGVNTRKFERQLRDTIRFEGLQRKTRTLEHSSSAKGSSETSSPQIVGRNKADELFEVVSAASILAKVQRDQRIEQLKQEFGEDFGSGYPSDPLTRAALKKWIAQDKLPVFVRKSWGTIQDLRNERIRSQTKPLDSWLK